MFFNTRVIPNDLKQSVFVKIPNKPKAVECTEYRTICLMSHVTKLLLRILMDRNEAIFEREISKGQTGFRSGLGTREGIFNIRGVLEKMIAINKDIDLYICFIDYQKAFDRVYHQKIMEFLNYTFLPLHVYINISSHGQHHYRFSYPMIYFRTSSHRQVHRRSIMTLLTLQQGTSEN